MHQPIGWTRTNSSALSLSRLLACDDKNKNTLRMIGFLKTCVTRTAAATSARSGRAHRTQVGAHVRRRTCEQCIRVGVLKHQVVGGEGGVDATGKAKERGLNNRGTEERVRKRKKEREDER